jgi:Fe-S-cluster-containing dehydrogenase component
MKKSNDKIAVVEEFFQTAGISPEVSRRGFLKLSLGTAASLSVCGMLASRVGAGALVIMDNAYGLVVGDPTKCVACGRCELACTEFNDGKAMPSMARIKVSRNFAYGQKGAAYGQNATGAWGNGLVVQDICRQCPHPVPCATACPQDAIVMDEKTRARVVAADKCIGCKMCQQACPWEVMTFDSEAGKATKCFLCNGKPKCVEACPSGAITFMPWRNLTRETPQRAVVLSAIPPDKAAGCMECHSNKK